MASKTSAKSRSSRNAKASDTPAVEAEATPTGPASDLDLIADVQARCESLRDWHRQTTDEFARREADLTAREEELDDRSEALDLERSAVAELRDQLRQEREAASAERIHLDREQSELYAAQRTLQNDLDRLAEARAIVARERQETAELRVELDGEWDSMCRLRHANEKLAEQLDSERQRQNSCQPTPVASGPRLAA